MEIIEKEELELIENILKKYAKIPDYSPIKNLVLELPSAEITYKLIRLNDDQFSMLAKNRVPISEDYGLSRYLSNRNILAKSFSKLYVTIKSVFGESGRFYDNWKGSFSFPFLIHFEKNGHEFDYLLNIRDTRASLEFWLAKVISAEIQSLNERLFRSLLKIFPKMIFNM